MYAQAIVLVTPLQMRVVEITPFVWILPGQKDELKPNGAVVCHLLHVCTSSRKQGQLAQWWQSSNTDVQTHAKVLLLIWLWSNVHNLKRKIKLGEKKRFSAVKSEQIGIFTRLCQRAAGFSLGKRVNPTLLSVCLIYNKVIFCGVS